MNYALVIVEASPANNQAVRNFAGSLQAAGLQIPPNTMLNEGAYLLPLQHGLSGLAALVSEARDRKLRLHTLFFDQPPPFVVTNA